jgi:hypothetical protein
MINKFLLEDIVCLIETFTGPNYWKLHFSNKVLPRINKSWRLVGIDPNDDQPCPNCYFYGNGIDQGCNNDPILCTFKNPVWVKKDDILSLHFWKRRFEYCIEELY